jgi:hypothetical protein
MTDVGQSQPLRVRWICPVWLTLEQARTCSSPPALVLRNLIAERRLRTRATPKGRLINRDSINRLLEETKLSDIPMPTYANSKRTTRTY